MSDERDNDDPIREGIGCILIVIAVVLAVVAFGTIDSLIDYINAQLGGS